MTALPPEIEAEGLRAYEQARAFENLRRQRLPLVYAGVTILLALSGGALLQLGHAAVAALSLGAAVLFPFFAWQKWRFLKVQYAANLRRLKELETRYGTEVTWLKIERHLAEVEKLRAELRAGEIE